MYIHMCILFSCLMLINKLNIGVFCSKSLEFVDTVPSTVIVNSINGDSYFSYAFIASKATLTDLGTIPSKLFIGSPKGYTGIWQCDLGLDLFAANVTIGCKTLSNLNNDVAPNQCGASNLARDPELYPAPISWQGGTISKTIENDEFLYCDYRWTIERQVHGICHTAAATETRNRRAQMGEKLKTFFLSKSSYDSSITDGRSTDLRYYSEFGFSSAFDKNSKLIIGAPLYDKKGKVVIYPNLKDLNRNQGCLTTIDFSPDIQDAPYYGYSLTSGNYFQPKVYLFAVGAPRRTLKEKLLSGSVFLLKSVSVNKMITHQEIFGDQIGSYFGSVLASANINGIGDTGRLDSLLIGAPMQRISQEKSAFDEGCVFIYSKKGETQRQFDNLDLKEKLCPSKISGGRFGSAIANLGDINQDFYEDIAVSAPFATHDDDGESIGVVYIFFGTRGRLSDNDPLKITASNFLKMIPGIQVKGFGTTIVGNVDLDGNGTPDFAIGSYLSKHISVYRTRPRLDISVTFNNNEQPMKYKREKTFVLKPCIEIVTKPSPRSPIELEIWIKVTADADSAEGSERFQIVSSDGKTQRTLLERLNLSNQKGCQVRELKVELKKQLEDSDVKDIRFEWEVWYNATFNRKTDPKIYYTNSSVVKFPGERQIPFCSYCPASTSREKVFNYSLPVADNCDDDGNPICTSDLKVTSTIKSGGEDITEYIIGSKKNLNLHVQVKNNKETAYLIQILLKLTFSSEEVKQIVKVSYREESCVDRTGSGRELTLMLDCFRSRPLHKDKLFDLQFQINLNGLKAVPYNETIKFMVEAYPSQYLNQKRISEPTTFSLLSEYDLELKSEQQDMIALSLSDSKLYQFIQTYEVRNPKPSPLDLVRIMFKIPAYRKINDKEEQFILIAIPLARIDSQTIAIPCNTSDTEGFTDVNFKTNRPRDSQNDKLVPTRNRRNSYANKISIQDQRNTSKPISLPVVDQDRKVLEISCGEKSNWKCIIVTCDVNIQLNDNKPLEIFLNLRLNTKLAKKILPNDLKELRISTKGEAKVFEKFTEAISTSRFDVIQTGEISALVLVGAVIGGLILFLLVTFCLFKCGFFRRKTKEELEALKAKTEEEEILAKNFPITKESL